MITINNEELTTMMTGCIKWVDISNEEVIFKRNEGLAQSNVNRREYYVLKFDYPGGSATIDLSHLDVIALHLDHLLYVYRNRWTHKIN